MGIWLPDVERLDIQNAFLEGINEVFYTLFTETVKFYLMDESATPVHPIYGESPEKVYLPPYDIVAKVVTSFNKEDLPDLTLEIDAIITVPTRMMIYHNIPRNTLEDLDRLRKAKFAYKEIDNYLVERVGQKTLVADEWQFYTFYCTIPKHGGI